MAWSTNQPSGRGWTRTWSSPAAVRYTHRTGPETGGELHPRSSTRPGLPAPNTASTAAGAAIAAAAAGSPLRQAVRNFWAASDAVAAGTIGSDVVVVAIVVAVVDVVSGC